MKTTRLEGLSYWGQYQPDRRIDFNGFHWASPAGGLVIDPMELDEAGLEELRQKGGVHWVLVTNAEHLRAGPAFKAAFDAPLLAPVEERERLGEEAAAVDIWYSGDGDLPDALQPVLELYPLHGGKSAMEPALYLKPLQALYFADLVRSHESGRLRLLPDQKISDPAAVQASLRSVEDLPVEAVLLGDGDGIYNGAAAAIKELLGLC